jgi:two-component system, NtrC family, response regulator AtoC
VATRSHPTHHPEDGTTPNALGDPRNETHVRIAAFWEGGGTSAWIAPGAQITIGRSKDCDIAIDLTSVSRVHARIVAGSPTTISDLGSSNGVRVGGVRVPKERETPLRSGEIVEIGSAVLIVQDPMRGTPSPTMPARAGDAGDVLARLVALVSKSDIGVLLLGETGVGKSLTAEAIHRASRRAQHPFLRINCAALPEALLEGELFGYERGAFSGAAYSKAGLLESADGGTVLLDEIGEMPLTTQAKLLSVLDTHETQRLGGLRPRHIDLRVLSASNRDLEASARAGTFRLDLFFRLNGISVTIPPLRARVGMIPTLVRDFVREASERADRRPPTISESALSWLVAQPWPGNIRELRSTVERAILLLQRDVLEVEDFTQSMQPFREGTHDTSSRPQQAGAESGPAGLRSEIERLERKRVEQALAACDGNQTKAARLLGLSRRALINRIESFGFPRPRRRDA